MSSLTLNMLNHHVRVETADDLHRLLHGDGVDCLVVGIFKRSQGEGPETRGMNKSNYVVVVQNCWVGGL